MRVYTTLWNINVRKKQNQPETCIMIISTPQRSITVWFKYDETFDHYFTTNLLLSLFWKNFWNTQHLAKLWEKVDFLKCPVRWGTVLLKNKELAWDSTWDDDDDDDEDESKISFGIVLSNMRIEKQVNEDCRCMCNELCDCRCVVNVIWWPYWQEVNELKRKVDELKQFESQCQKLMSKLQVTYAFL